MYIYICIHTYIYIYIYIYIWGGAHLERVAEVCNEALAALHLRHLCKTYFLTASEQRENNVKAFQGFYPISYQATLSVQPAARTRPGLSCVCHIHSKSSLHLERVAEVGDGALAALQLGLGHVLNVAQDPRKRHIHPLISCKNLNRNTSKFQS